MQWDKEPTSSSYTSQETAKSLQKFVATKAPSQKEVLKVGKKKTTAKSGLLLKLIKEGEKT